MKLSVWTATNIKTGVAKCIYLSNAKRQAVPRIGESIVLYPGGCCETVRSVIHNLTDGYVEISITNADYDNVYGPCKWTT